MSFKVIKIKTFEKRIKQYKIPKNIVDKIIGEVAENPYSGRYLNYKFLREKRYKDKRMYFLIYEKAKIVLLVSASDKKAQDKTIKEIKNILPHLKSVVDDYLSNSG